MQEDKYAIQENMMQILMGVFSLAEDGQEMNTASILFISDADFCKWLLPVKFSKSDGVNIALQVMN